MYQGDEIMAQKLDYSREDAMQILNNTNCSDEDKRSQYEEYMNNLKKTRKNAIVTKLNDLAREIPTITKDIYISVLKKYENDDLSIPFEVIESELSDFEKEMRKKYDEYLESQKQEEIEEDFLKRIAEVLGISEEVIKDFDVEKTIFNINHHNYKDANISEGATTYAIVQQINPLEKIVELYERLLKSEQDKIEILKKYMK